MRRLPEPGDRVRVPWGRGTAEAEVVNAYESGIGGQVTVEVRLDDSGDVLTVTFPVDAVEPATAA